MLAQWVSVAITTTIKLNSREIFMTTTQPSTRITSTLTRRAFLVSSAAASGALSVGFHVPALATTPTKAATDKATAVEVNAWVVIQPNDECIIKIARAEMGQGTSTGLAQLVAEELECDWNKVKIQHITPGENLARKRVWRNMATGGSRGIRESQEYVRQGGAAARMMLLQAAAKTWSVPVGDLKVSKGVITHMPTARTLRFGQVCASAATLTPPDVGTITLKPPYLWTIAGKPIKRLDTAQKVNGALKYAIDYRPDDILFAALKIAPVFQSTIKSFDASETLKRRGIKKVVRIDDSTIAVVADNWWRAKTALDAMPITWEEGENGKVSSASIAEHLREGLTSDKNVFADTNTGKFSEAFDKSSKKIESVYSTPFVTHACMEPMNCTVRYTPERAEAWVPTQNAEAALAALADASGLPAEKCEAYNHTLGGGFGRRGGPQDYVRYATIVAKEFPGRPVKVLWSREEDMTHDIFRPIGLCKLQAGLDDKGNLTALSLRVSGQSINAHLAPHNIVDGKDRRQLQGYWPEPGDAQLGYSVPNLKIEYAMRNTHVPVGPWRGVNTNQNAIYLECFMEEVAKASGKDSLEFRRSLLKTHPKHLGVLNAVADKAGWGRTLPAGVHQGIAQFMGYGSYTAAIAEVSVTNGKVKVLRLVLATNCGHVVNPDQVAAQVEGSVAYGFDSLISESSVANGRIVESNFDRYKIARMVQMPKIETVLAPTFDFWGGVGEPTICVVAPAIMNAIYTATGKPVRSLPLKNEGLELV
jgi:isoquinoline 1-oxidoreductase beta subunit